MAHQQLQQRSQEEGGSGEEAPAPSLHIYTLEGAEDLPSDRAGVDEWHNRHTSDHTPARSRKARPIRSREPHRSANRAAQARHRALYGAYMQAPGNGTQHD